MGKAALAPKEPGGQRGDRSRAGLGRLFEGPEDDLLEPSNVDQLKGESALASLFEALAPVLLGQPNELLSLPELGPREVTGKELLHEAPDALAELLGLGNGGVGISPGVGSEILGIVVVVGRASSRGLWEVGLDQLPPEEDADQRTITADGDWLADVACGDRVGRLQELDMMIGMDLALGPARGVEAFSHQRTERRLLLFLEDGEGTAPGGAVDPGAGDLETPSGRFALHVLGVEEALTPKEVLADVGHHALDMRLPRRVANHGRIDDEASVLRVLTEGPLEDRVVAIGLGDGRRQVVFDDAGGHPAKELPSCFQAVDHILELLPAGDVNVHVAAVNEDHDQSPEQLPTLGLGIKDVAETTEVDLADLPRAAVRATDSDLSLAELAVLDREAVKRAVGDPHPMSFEEGVDLSQGQAPLPRGPRKPVLDLRPPRKQYSLALTRLRILRYRT